MVYSKKSRVKKTSSKFELPKQYLNELKKVNSKISELHYLLTGITDLKLRETISQRLLGAEIISITLSEPGRNYPVKEINKLLSNARKAIISAKYLLTAFKLNKEKNSFNEIYQLIVNKAFKEKISVISNIKSGFSSKKLLFNKKLFERVLTKLFELKPGLIELNFSENTLLLVFNFKSKKEIPLEIIDFCKINKTKLNSETSTGGTKLKLSFSTIK